MRNNIEIAQESKSEWTGAIGIYQSLHNRIKHEFIVWHGERVDLEPLCIHVSTNQLKELHKKLGEYLAQTETSGTGQNQ